MGRRRHIVHTYHHGRKATARGREGRGFAGWFGEWFPWVAQWGPSGTTRRARRMKARRRRYT